MEVLEWESASTWLVEDGCCMWWFWCLGLCCGLFLTCRLLCSRCFRLWLQLENCFESILCQVASCCVFMRRACIFFLFFLFFSVAHGWFWLAVYVLLFKKKKKIYTQKGFSIKYFISHVCLCVVVLAHERTCTHRSMLPSLTSFKLKLFALSQVLCIITDSLFPPHIL